MEAELRAHTRAGRAHVVFFPNPVRDRVTFMASQICWCKVGAICIRLYDLTGVLVWTGQAARPYLDCNLDLDELILPNGTYIVTFSLLIGSTGWQPAGVSTLTVLR